MYKVLGTICILIALINGQGANIKTLTIYENINKNEEKCPYINYMKEKNILLDHIKECNKTSMDLISEFNNGPGNTPRCIVFYNAFLYCPEQQANKVPPDYSSKSIEDICTTLQQHLMQMDHSNASKIVFDMLRSKCDRACTDLSGQVYPLCSLAAVIVNVTVSPPVIPPDNNEEGNSKVGIIAEDENLVPEKVIASDNNQPLKGNNEKNSNSAPLIQDLKEQLNSPNNINNQLINQAVNVSHLVKHVEVDSKTSEVKQQDTGNKNEQVVNQGAVDPVISKLLMQQEKVRDSSSNKAADAVPKLPQAVEGKQEKPSLEKPTADNGDMQQKNVGPIQLEQAVKSPDGRDHIEKKIQDDLTIKKTKVEEKAKDAEAPDVDAPGHQGDGKQANKDPHIADYDDEKNGENVDNAEDKDLDTDENIVVNDGPKKLPGERLANKPDNLEGDGGIESDQSYFFSYFMTICVLFVLCYVGYHNKQKILALILEGRKGRRTSRSRRPNSANYHKLDSNLEEAVTSSCNKNTTQIIY